MQFLADSATICNIQQGAGKIPFICFDLAGGANIAGSNVLVGKEGGQLDFLSTQGYSKQGLPGDMLPNNATTNFINTEFGLAFHSDSAFLRGMLEKTSATTRAGVNGAVIAARSENDTGNNPHNPMYGIAKAGVARRAADADRLAELRLRRQLDGAGDADGSGESPDQDRSRQRCDRPGRHRRARHAVHAAQRSAGHGLHGRGHGADGAHQRTEAAARSIRLIADGARLETQVKCGYVKTADTVDRFSSPAALNPALDPDITGAGGVFGANFGNDGEFQKTASVMKLVVEGYAGAGTISMGGFDYHTGDRVDRRAARPARGPLHRRVPGVRGASRQAADDLRVQRRLAVVQRHGRRFGRRSRQGPVDRRQPADGCVVLPGLQPADERRPPGAADVRQPARRVTSRSATTAPAATS